MSQPIKIPPKALNLSQTGKRNLWAVHSELIFEYLVHEDPSGSPLDVARVGMAPKTFTTRRTRTTSVTQVDIAKSKVFKVVIEN